MTIRELPAEFSGEAFLLLSTHWKVGQVLDRAAGEALTVNCGLGRRELVLLSLIDGGMAYPSDLARELELPRYFISRALDKFERDGLVNRAFDEQDARRTRFTLTPTGKELQIRALTLLESVLRPWFELYGIERVRQLAIDLETLARMFVAVNPQADTPKWL